MTAFEDRGLPWQTTPRASDQDILPAPRGIAVRLRRLVAALLRWLKAGHKRRLARRQLREMSDWQLKDIGIGRCEIEHWVQLSPPRGRRSSHAEH
jgi:uncharacterized protein YjiS (DUF1127 family)